MRFIDELRKCDPTSIVRAPTLETDPNRRWVGTPIGYFLAAWDQLERERDHYKAQIDMQIRYYLEDPKETEGKR